MGRNTLNRALTICLPLIFGESLSEQIVLKSKLVFNCERLLLEVDIGFDFLFIAVGIHKPLQFQCLFLRIEADVIWVREELQQLFCLLITHKRREWDL